jgi:hypothetical protein
MNNHRAPPLWSRNVVSRTGPSTPSSGDLIGEHALPAEEIAGPTRQSNYYAMRRRRAILVVDPWVFAALTYRMLCRGSGVRPGPGAAAHVRSPVRVVLVVADASGDACPSRRRRGPPSDGSFGPSTFGGSEPIFTMKWSGWRVLPPVAAPHRSTVEAGAFAPPSAASCLLCCGATLLEPPVSGDGTLVSTREGDSQVGCHPLFSPRPPPPKAGVGPWLQLKPAFCVCPQEPQSRVRFPS